MNRSSKFPSFKRARAKIACAPAAAVLAVAPAAELASAAVVAAAAARIKL